MARTSIQQMAAVLDPLQTWNWDIAFPRIPGVSDTRQLSYRAISTSIPGTSIEKVTWEGHGVKLNFAGKRSYEETWEFTVIEARDSSSRDMILGWMDLTRNWVANSGSYKSDYAVPVELTLYDDLPKAVRGIKLVNAFPTQIGQVQLDTGSELIKYAITLAFDYFEDIAPSDTSASVG